MIKIITLLLLCTITVCAKPITAEEWYVDVSGINESLEELLETYNNSPYQQQRNATIVKVCRLLRQKLYETYQTYRASLPEELYAEADRAMRNWLAYEDKRTSDEYNRWGGTFAAQASGDLSKELMLAKIEFLEKITIKVDYE